MITPTEKTILSVSQLNRQAKLLLETHLPLIWVSGELSNFAQPSSGHWYFSLKDERAQVRCAMFRQANQRLRWQPQAGKQVLVRARVSLYEGRGDYQLIIEHMEESGHGALQRAYEALKEKLQQEGLFDESLKQSLPNFPQHIGIVTSPSGAAVRDILSVLQRRYPIAQVTILPVAVQGNEAATEMTLALKKAAAFNQFDILIMSRGGGSIEDLWAFNDEQLARAIIACPIPIVSAVGHEIDFTICDFVADLRAPTPSASAEIISPDLQEWQQALDHRSQQLLKSQQSQLTQKAEKLVFLRKRLRHPGERIRSQQAALLTAKRALRIAIAHRLAQANLALKQLTHRQQQQSPDTKIHQYKQQLRQYVKRMKRASGLIMNKKKQQLANYSQLLNAVSPLEVLGRGYAIVSQKDQGVVQNINQVETGEELTIRLKQGRIISTVKDVEPDS